MFVGVVRFVEVVKALRTESASVLGMIGGIEGRQRTCAGASRLRSPPRSSCISSVFNPLLSRNAAFLSVEASRTSSSSKNFFACSITILRSPSIDLVSGVGS